MPTQLSPTNQEGPQAPKAWHRPRHHKIVKSRIMSGTGGAWREDVVTKRDTNGSTNYAHFMTASAGRSVSHNHTLMTTGTTYTIQFRSGS